MTSARGISRRDLLRAALLGAGAVVAAACGATPGPTVRPSPSDSTGPSGSPSPDTSPRPTPATTPPASPTPAPSSTLPQEPPLDQVIAGLLIVGFRGLTLATDSWVRAAIDAGLGGVILFDRDQNTGRERNIHSPDQVAALVNQLHGAAGGRKLIVSIDQEGGVVTRLSPAHGFPAIASEAAIGRGTVATARTWAATIARSLAKAGIDLNFAPVVDLDVNPTSAAIGALDRSFSADADVVVRMATIEVDAHRAAGVRTVLKHFPGIGGATTNTDLGIADVSKTWTRNELEPFRRLIAGGTADAIMAGHVINRQLDPRLPASLSRAVVTDLLRGELGWLGPVVTDDLQAGAITKAFGQDEAIVRALEAGNDLLLFANQQVYQAAVVPRTVAAVQVAVESGRLSEVRLRDSWRRVRAAFSS